MADAAELSRRFYKLFDIGGWHDLCTLENMRILINEFEKARGERRALEETARARLKAMSDFKDQRDSAHALLLEADGMMRDMREWQSDDAVSDLRARIAKELQ
jgi:hypothetical protein